MAIEPKTVPQGTAANPDTVDVSATRRGSDYAGQMLGGRYQILRLLGAGGMGWVFLGKHIAVGRPVAVKILKCERVTKQEGSKRLFREARAAAAIGHPSIIDVLDVGTSPFGDPYLVMEYLKGEDLAGLIRRVGRLSLGAACGVFEPILQALQVAHSRGIIHRDLKPANIYLVPREDSAPVVKLIDFGISKVLGASELASITAAGSMVGTPAYMAPEQARGEEDIDGRADLYAVGIMLYQVVTGKLPFEGSNYNHLIFKIVSDDIELPPSEPSELPEAARDLIQRAVSKNPSRRQQSASQLLEELRALDAWPQRTRELTKLSTHIRSIAPADELHGTTQLSPAMSSEEAVTVSRESSAVGLVEFKRDGAKHTTPDKRGSLLSMAAAITAALLVSSLVGVLVLWRSTSPAGKAVDPSPGTEAAARTPPAPDGVQIMLIGVPEGATVRYDGAPVALNPFRVKAQSAIAAIRVEAPGHKPFVTTVVPTRDTSVEVKLVPAAGSTQPEPARPAGSAKQHRALPPGSRQSRDGQKPAGIGKSGRDTLFSEEFE